MSPWATSGLIGLVTVAAAHLLQARVGLNYADEGFLVNGIRRTAAGETPVRDFRAYDPLRYVFAAALAPVTGAGPLGVRRAFALVQLGGVVLGVALLRLATHDVALLAGGAVLLIWWMQPRHKVIDAATSTWVVALTLGALHADGPADAAAVGAGVGIAALVLRNHGAYALASSGLVLLVRLVAGDLPASDAQLVGYVGGVAAGWSPMLLLFATRPGTAAAYWRDMVRVLGRTSTAYLLLPVPWPWRWRRGEDPWLDAAARLAHGVALLLLPGTYVAGVAVGLTREGPAADLALAASVVGAAYLHHVLTRADLGHLVQAGQPFVLATAGLLGALQPAAPTTALALLALGAVSVAAAPFVPLVERLRPSIALDPVDVGGDLLLVRRAVVGEMEAARRLLGRNGADGTPLLIAPFFPMLYVYLDRAVPVADDYLLFPQTEQQERRMIADLERHDVEWALLSDVRLDDRDDRCFRATHPLVAAHLDERFEVVDDAGGWWRLELHRRRDRG